MVITDPFSLTEREKEIIRYRPTQIHIDVIAIKENIRRIKKLVSPSLVSVVVKGNAYGHGLSAISLALCDSEADVLCVATPESALTLRKRGVDMPMLILTEPTPDAIVQCYEHNITLCVYTKNFIDKIDECIDGGEPAHIHLEVDTGMNRLGCEPQEAIELAKYISSKKNVFLEGIYTHFASADVEGSNQPAEQLALFKNVLEELDEQNLLPPIVHAANSAAAITMPDARFSMVRIGAAAYGGYPADFIREMIDLQEAIEFSTEITFIKTVQSGEAISYGGYYVASKETQIATIPAGYSDGVPRSLSFNDGEVLVNGVRCPIVGAITMDFMMIDVSKANANVGDKVILLGKQGEEIITPDDWAEKSGRIRYEIITALGERIPRTYFGI